MRNPDRYAAPVHGVGVDELPTKLRASIDGVLKLWPRNTLVTIFVMEPGKPGGGLAYISNAERADMLNVVREWLDHQERLQ